MSVDSIYARRTRANSVSVPPRASIACRCVLCHMRTSACMGATRARRVDTSRPVNLPTISIDTRDLTSAPHHACAYIQVYNNMNYYHAYWGSMYTYQLHRQLAPRDWSTVAPHWGIASALLRSSGPSRRPTRFGSPHRGIRLASHAAQKFSRALCTRGIDTSVPEWRTRTSGSN